MINTNQKAIDARDLKFNDLFLNLQGNILKGHGRNHTTNIFVKFGAGKTVETKQWLKDFGENTVTSCKTQLRETERFQRNKVPGGMFFGIYLSAKGYEYLEKSAGNPNPLAKFQDQSFVQGMKNAALQDPPVANWEEGFRGEIHAMILMADVDENKIGERAKLIIEEINQFGEVLTIEYGNAIRNANNDGLEHFGYVDGISQPLFFKDEVDENKAVNLQPLKFDPSAELDLVLTPDPFSTAVDAFGSYFVFRKLEEDVRGFKEAEEALAATLGLTGEDKERAGAMIVGRFEDGTPVTLSDTDKMLSSGVMNNFNYNDDKKGAKCPFHGHIRKTNPRRDDNDKKHIMARRGITFGHRNVNTEVDPIFEQMPHGGVGLLFMSFQKSLVNQFEFIQKTWANNKDFPHSNDGIDPIIGQGLPTSTGKFAQTYGDATTLQSASFDEFVHFRGGEYFFAPSIPYLTHL